MVMKLSQDDMVRFYKNFEVLSLENLNQCVRINGDKTLEFDHVINAIQPRNCASFMNLNMDGFDGTLFNLSSSLITVNMVFKNDTDFVNSIRDKFKGFGVLIPRDMNEWEMNGYHADNSLLGIIYYSSVFPLFDDIEDENNALSLVFMFGGPQFDVYHDSMSKEKIINMIKERLRVCIMLMLREKKRLFVMMEMVLID